MTSGAGGAGGSGRLGDAGVEAGGGNGGGDAGEPVTNDAGGSFDCSVHADPQSCAADAGCVWLQPGYPYPTIKVAGCYIRGLPPATCG